MAKSNRLLLKSMMVNGVVTPSEGADWFMAIDNAHSVESLMGLADMLVTIAAAKDRAAVAAQKREH